MNNRPRKPSPPRKPSAPRGPGRPARPSRPSRPAPTETRDRPREIRPRRGRGDPGGGMESGGAEGMLVGLNPVEAALAACRRPMSSLHVRAGVGADKVGRLREAAEALRIPVREMTPDALELLAPGQHHQGVVLRCGPLPLLAEHEALALGAWRADQARSQGAGAVPPLLVALDQVEDPRNLGAVVRAAEAFGAAGLAVPRDHSAPLSAVASAASAGALERFPVYQVANLARFLDQAKRSGFWTLGTAVEGGEPLAGYTHDRPAVLVLGNEGRGLRPLVARSCDTRLTIPLAGRATAAAGGQPGLNVASAAAVLLYHLMTHR